MRRIIKLTFAKDAIMPEVRGLIVAKDLERFGSLVQLQPDVRNNECLPSNTPLILILESDHPKKEIEKRLVHPDIQEFKVTEEDPEKEGGRAKDPQNIQTLLDRLETEWLISSDDPLKSLDHLGGLVEEIEAAACELESYASIHGSCIEGRQLLEKLREGDSDETRNGWESFQQVIKAIQNQLNPVGPDCGPSPGLEGVKETLSETSSMATPSRPSTVSTSLYTIEKDPEMAACFAGEASEHLETAEIELLTLETDSANEESLNAIFRAFHTIKGSSALLGLQDISTLAHEAENLLGMARDGKIVLADLSMDLVFETVDVLKGLVTAVNETLCSGVPFNPGQQASALIPKIKALVEGELEGSRADMVSNTFTSEPLGEVLVECGFVDQETVEEALNLQASSPDAPRLGEILVREKKASAKEVALALRSQKQLPPSQQGGVREFVKVDAIRLDRLIDMIGELVIAESMVSQSTELKESASPSLTKHLGQLDKITRELQEMGTSLRMVPVRPTFQKMARLVRDLAHKADKKIDFVMHGEDTELDKTVVDKIGDPLVHMIRNSVDHGIEGKPEDRIALGKSPAGRIELRAYHKGGSIHIEIHDDGRGLDREAILKKGIERGLVRPGEVLSDREIFNMIFSAGFSTAKTITDVSGRGVGMDVVKKNIDTLRGQVEILSEPGHGTLFTIRLPLTLAIIDGMVVRIGSERYIIPTLSIVQSIRPDRSNLSSILSKGRMLRVQGNLIPLFALWELLSIRGAQRDPTLGTAVVVEDEGRQAALLVDALIGQQQVVIKPLGEMFRGIPGLAGGAIMPDGAVGLILDVAGIVEIATTDEPSSHIAESSQGILESIPKNGSCQVVVSR